MHIPGGPVEAYKIINPEWYVSYAIDNGDGYAVWGANAENEHEGIGDADDLQEAVQLINDDAADRQNQDGQQPLVIPEEEGVTVTVADLIDMLNDEDDEDEDQDAEDGIE